MKNYLIPCILFVSIFLVLSFQTSRTEYRIVDGHFAYWPNQIETYYMWDDTNKRSYEVNNRQQMITIMQNQGYELVSTYSHQAANSGGYSRFQITWIFKK